MAERARLPRQLGLFVVVGLLGTAVYVGLYNLIRLGLPPLGANVLALVGSMAFSFFAHRRYTFARGNGANRSSPMWRQATSFTFVFLLTLGLSSVLLLALEWMEGPRTLLRENVAILGATGTAFLVRFALLRRWVFPDVERGPADRVPGA
jgi:putative flippase GtrA